MRYLFILWIVLIALQAFPIEVGKVVVAPDTTEIGQLPETRTEIILVEYEPGEEALARAVLNNEISATTRSNPNATVDILCGNGGAMPNGACTALREEVSRQNRPNVAVEEVTNAEPVRKGSDWKGRLAIIRVISNGTTASMTALLLQGAGWTEVAGVFGAAGAWTGTMQMINRPRLNWQNNSGWFDLSPPRPGEPRAGFLKRLAKRAIQSGAYALLMAGAYYVTGLNAESLSPATAITVAGSLYVNTAWEALNHYWRQEAIRRDPGREYLYQRYSGLGTLALSMANVAQVAVASGGFHLLSYVIAGTIGTTGTVTWFWDRVPQPIRTPVEATGRLIRSTCDRLLGLMGERTPTPAN